MRRISCGVAFDRVLHPEGRVAGPHGVILVGEGCPEERHDAVAGDLVHGPFVPVNRLHHALEDRVEKLPGVLGVTVGQQLHGPLHVRKQHGYVLALPHEGAVRSEDLLGEMPGGIGVRRKEARLNGAAKGLRTLPAKVVARGIARAARRADQRQRGRTLAAELHARRILCLAPRTLHRMPLGSRVDSVQGVRQDDRAISVGQVGSGDYLLRVGHPCPARHQ